MDVRIDGDSNRENKFGLGNIKEKYEYIGDRHII